MSKKKSVYSWIVFVLFSIAAFLLTLSAVFLLFSIVVFSAVSDSPELQVSGTEIQGILTQHFLLKTIVTLVSTVILLALSVNFLFRLYKVTPDLIKWTHITFGLVILLDVFSILIADPISSSSGLFEVPALLDPVSLIRLGLTVAIWVTFAMHLKKAKAENSMDFS